MFDTPQQVAQQMHELGLPSVFERIWKSQGSHRFCRQWDRPVRFFDVWDESVQDCPRIGNCVPILESNREHVVAFDVKQHEFVEYYFGDSECRHIGKSYQQFLSWLFIDLGYAGLMDLVEEVAGDFEYQHLGSLVKFMEMDDDTSAEDAKHAFVDSVPT